MYYVRVSSADTNLFGAGSEYELRVYVPIGPGGGVIRITSGPGFPGIAYLQIYLGPQEAINAHGGWQVPSVPSYAGGPALGRTSCLSNPLVRMPSTSRRFLVGPGQQHECERSAGTLTRVYATYTRSPSLSVNPAGGLAAGGSVHGPFTPGSTNYTLSNSGESPCDWTASKTRRLADALASQRNASGWCQR